MNRNFALMAAASVVVGGMSILGCEQDRDDVRTTRVYELDRRDTTADTAVVETRSGTVVATDGENTTAVRTPAPRGDNAAERMGLSVQDAPTGGRGGGDVTVRTRAEGGTAIDEPGRADEGSNVTGPTGVGDTGNPLSVQTGGGGAAGATAGSGATDTRRTDGNDGDGNSGLTTGTDRGQGTSGGVVVPPYDDGDDVIVRDRDSSNARQAGDRSDSNNTNNNTNNNNRSDGRQADPNNPQRRAVDDPGAPGSITETANPGGQTTPRQGDPGAPGSVTSVPRGGDNGSDRNPTAGGGSSDNPTAGNRAGGGSGGNAGGGQTGSTGSAGGGSGNAGGGGSGGGSSGGASGGSGGGGGAGGGGAGGGQ